MSAKATYTYVIAMATSNTGLDNLTTQLAAAREWAIGHEIYYPYCCNLPGDADNDGRPNICDAEGDANADGAINIGDAVYLFNYVFNGGPSPMCGPEIGGK